MIPPSIVEQVEPQNQVRTESSFGRNWKTALTLFYHSVRGSHSSKLTKAHLHKNSDTPG